MKELPANTPIKIIGFYAKDNLALCEHFTQGYLDVLHQHGFSHFKKKENYWLNDSDAYVVMALMDDEPVGGIRLEFKREDRLLLYEKALLPTYPEIEQFTQKLDASGLAMPCNLWNSRAASGLNLSLYLSRASIAAAPLVGAKTVISFNATYTFRIPQDVGCEMVTDYGDEGYFNYPTDQFKAGIWLHTTLDTLEKALPQSRDRILSLRAKPHQLYTEFANNKELQIQYELNF